VRVIVYILAPFATYFVSLIAFAQWWTALLEMAAIGLIALKAADHYDKHHMGGKYDDRRRNAEALNKYMQEYTRRREEDS
jgi:hypothetical protein